MAQLYMQGAQDPDSIKSIKAINAGAPKRGITGYKTVPAGTAIDDQIIVGKVPSHAIPLPGSTIVHENLGAGVTADIGFAEQGPAVLGSALALSAAGTKAGLAAVTTPNMGKTFWQLAGYSADPRRELTIVITIKGAATGSAGNVFAHFEYVVGT